MDFGVLKTKDLWSEVCPRLSVGARVAMKTKLYNTVIEANHPAGHRYTYLVKYYGVTVDDLGTGVMYITSIIEELCRRYNVTGALVQAQALPIAGGKHIVMTYVGIDDVCRKSGINRVLDNLDSPDVPHEVFDVEQFEYDEGGRPKYVGTQPVDLDALIDLKKIAELALANPR